MTAYGCQIRAHENLLASMHITADESIRMSARIPLLMNLGHGLGDCESSAMPSVVLDSEAPFVKDA